jgi:hypothetical protein
VNAGGGDVDAQIMADDRAVEMGIVEDKGAFRIGQGSR